MDQADDDDRDGTDRLARGAESYRKGEKSIEAAAHEAGVPLWTMIDHVTKENIDPPSQPRENLETEFEEANR